MKYYLESIQTVFSAVKSSENGISSAEAESRLQANGKNKLAEGKKQSLIARFFGQMTDPMIIVLLVAAAISAATGIIEHGKLEADVFIILFVVILNAVLGVYQESKAEKAIEALQEMAAATSKVIRDGEIVTVKSEDLVVGDVILLEAGDAIPADARIFESASLKIEEAALTGESVPVGKIMDMLGLESGEDVPLGDRKNMVYMGSSVAYGRGKAVIVATAMDTEMGKIADAISKAEEGDTPLQKKLNQLSKILSIVVLAICVAIFVIQLVADMMNGSGIEFSTVLSSFMIAVSLAVAAIPEGLAAVVTIVLSIGVTNMSKKNAIIRKLTAVETLGCAQIICSDKTGTLTQNKMTVVDHYGEDEKALAKAMALCTDANITSDGVVGEPTEVALVNYALSLEMNKTDMQAASPRVAEAPFDSVRKMMSTIHSEDGRFMQFTKGAPDEILKVCTKALVGGKVVDLTEDIRAEVMAANKGMADKALRVLAAAYKPYTAVPENVEPQEIEQDLIFLGLTGMIDPVRPEVKDAIVECGRAGIRPIMITGDHRDTAIAIARELGILENEAQAITGAQLSQMDDAEFDAKVGDFSVYARVQPEHKVRIVNAWRKQGKITAMTGDGVNDAPSIKSADIGVGMGITGTDVTKNVADMVLADDNFASIVSAVGEGRRIYDNIRKAIQFLLSSNLSEVLVILFSTVFMAGLLRMLNLADGTINTTVLLPVHLLWINLVTDCFPAVALGMEKAEPDIMDRRPRKSTDGIFAGGLGADCIYQGVLVTILTLVAYVIGYTKGHDADGYHNIAMTMAFLTMSMCEIFHSYNMRSQRNSIFKLGTHNKFLFGAMLLSLVLTTGVIYVPFLAEAFHFAKLPIMNYFESMLLAVSIIPIVEIVKFFQRRVSKDR